MPLDNFFSAQSVAVVGVSRDPNKVGHVIFRNFIDGGYQGKIFAVNPNAENILNHELGHWLGLEDQYDAANFQYATMYGYGSKGEVLKNTLTDGDNTGAFSIYNP